MRSFLHSICLAHVLIPFLGMVLPGCSDKPLEYTEVKRIDEVVSQKELDKFFEIVNLLPEKKLPAHSVIFREPVTWSASRTLPVSELTKEEQTHIERPWDPEFLAKELESNGRLLRILRRARVTPQQFTGLMLAIGTAMNRSRLPDKYPFDEVVRRGQKVIEKLGHVRTPFVDFATDQQYSITRDSIWLNRVDRAKRLRDVPDENVKLVRKHWETLSKIFPREFTVDPLDIIADNLEANGTPFEELAETGYDPELRWDPSQAILGTDTISSSDSETDAP